MKTLNLNKAALAIVITITLGACSSSIVDEHNKVVAAEVNAKNGALLERVEAAPDWYLNPPKNNAHGIYGVGMGRSASIQFSKSKAQLQAEFDLAKKYGQEISGQERSFLAESGSSGQLRQDASQVIDKLVKEQDISGYDIISSNASVSDGKVTTYVLLHLPFDEQNKVKQGKASLAQKIEAKQAYEDLIKKIEASKKVNVPQVEKEVIINNDDVVGKA